MMEPTSTVPTTMKTTFPSPRPILLVLSVFCSALPCAGAATLLTMTFDNGNADIVETAGWDGTTAPGGVLATGLVVTTGMTIYGDFTAQNAPNSFEVDNWHTTNSATTRVGMTVDALPGYTFSLGGGSETFSTKIHQKPTNVNQIFNSVELYINGTLIGSQPYVPAGGSQTLVWNIPANPLLNGLTTAVIDLKFPGITNAGNNHHGPEWNAADGAFVTFTGTIVPEASHAALACMGMIGFMFARRRG